MTRTEKKALLAKQADESAVDLEKAALIFSSSRSPEAAAELRAAAKSYAASVRLRDAVNAGRMI